MIGISAPLFDSAGSITLREMPTTDLGETRRRNSRIATLDGGVVVNDSGYSQGDRTIVVRWRARGDELRKVDRLVQSYPALTVATRIGVFDAAVQSLTTRNGISELTLLVKDIK